jgi:hypothetical protein
MLSYPETMPQRVAQLFLVMEKGYLIPKQPMQPDLISAMLKQSKIRWFCLLILLQSSSDAPMELVLSVFFSLCTMDFLDTEA